VVISPNSFFAASNSLLILSSSVSHAQVLSSSKASNSPLSARVVRDVEGGGMLSAVQEVYRSHGWPDLVRYEKRNCLADVKAMLQERFPDDAEEIEDEEDAEEI
jgi:hypothetical protein